MAQTSQFMEEEKRILDYLNSFDGSASFPRHTCCNSSRSLYCEECCKLLVPDAALPDPISLRREKQQFKRSNFCATSCDTQDERKSPLNLPFNLHIVLDDRRCSATGLHAVALLNNGEGEDGTANCFGSVKLIDVANGDEIPNYSTGHHTQLLDADTISNDLIDQSEREFLLFPSPGESVPIESVANQIETLVVLDCKWRKSSLCRTNANLAKLRKVHLSNSPKQTHYWRWHNAGLGCVSTIEAIFYAATEISDSKYQHMLATDEVDKYMLDQNRVDQSNLIYLLWLFGHQRAATIEAALKRGKPAPGSAEGKEAARSLRKQTGEYAWRSERNKKIGKILKEECRRMKRLALEN